VYCLEFFGKGQEQDGLYTSPSTSLQKHRYSRVAAAEIQTKDVNPVSRHPCLRYGDGKTELVDGLGSTHREQVLILVKMGKIGDIVSSKGKSLVEPMVSECAVSL